MDVYSHVEEILFKELKERVNQVITNDKDLVDIKFLYAYDVAQFLESEYGADVETSDMDTNGWQYDYLIPVYINDKKYVLSGSGYHGDVQFYKDHDDDDDDYLEDDE